MGFLKLRGNTSRVRSTCQNTLHRCDRGACGVFYVPCEWPEDKSCFAVISKENVGGL